MLKYMGKCFHFPSTHAAKAEPKTSIYAFQSNASQSVSLPGMTLLKTPSTTQSQHRHHMAVHQQVSLCVQHTKLGSYPMPLQERQIQRLEWLRYRQGAYLADRTLLLGNL